MSDGDNIIWGNAIDQGDNIVWGNIADDNIVWGNLFDDNVVWGNSRGDNIIWGNSVSWDGLLVTGLAPDLSRAHRTRTQGGL